jgi:acetate kinase
VDRLNPPALLCVNAGSSTLKCARYELVDGTPREVDRTEVAADPRALDDALERLAGELDPSVVAHRVVHGGPRLDQHCVLDDRVVEELRGAIPFAPVHLPAELAAIDAVARRMPDARQVVCFDTTFHRTMPEVARRLPLPAALDAAGVRRFGFHGLSCEYVVGAVGATALGRAVIAHLGSGASLTAIRDGRSVDTTMGLTPTGGVVMATRTGDLDPGVLLHLGREHDLDADALEDLVNRRSGLLGLSGTTGDMRALLDALDDGDANAALAVDAFCASVRKHVGALTAVLGGLDTLVFTGGIGEHAPRIRRRVCEGLEHLGVEGDAGSVQVRVVATDENLVIAGHAARLTGLTSGT